METKVTVNENIENIQANVIAEKSNIVLDKVNPVLDKVNTVGEKVNPVGENAENVQQPELDQFSSKELHKKNNLHKLNSRLQQYVLRMQEMNDAKLLAEKELENTRACLQQEVVLTKQRLTLEVEETRSLLDKEIDQRVRLELLEQEQHSEITKLRKELKEYDSIKEIADHVQRELNNKNLKLEETKKKLELEHYEVIRLQRHENQLTKKVRSMEVELSDNQLELVDLRTENKKYANGRDDQLVSIQKQLNEQHARAEQAWKKDLEVKVNAVESDLRTYYENVMEDLKKQNSELNKDNEVRKQEYSNLSNEFEDKVSSYETIMEKLNILERKFNANRKEWKNQKDMFQDTIATLRASNMEKQDQLNQLIDDKLTLDTEISTYHMILDREEGRLDLPSTKRKSMTPSTSSKRSKVSEETVDANIIAEYDVPSDNTNVVIDKLIPQENKIIIRNDSNEPVNLDGWSVSSTSSSHRFRFPSFELPPHQKVTVISGGSRKAASANINGFMFYTKRYMWKSNDTATLSNQNQDIVFQFPYQSEIIASNEKPWTVDDVDHKDIHQKHPEKMQRTLCTSSRTMMQFKKIAKKEALPFTSALNDCLSNLKPRKFDESVDVAIQLGIDTKKADQRVRGVVSLPHGTGKKIKIAVFAKGDKADVAKAAGASVVGGEDLVKEIQAGNLDFDRCIATPDMMPLIGRVARILGPRGLMPNPKLGTVTTDVAAAIKVVAGGQVEFRAEKFGIIHANIGKVNFTKEQIVENFRTLMVALSDAKPEGAKGKFIVGAHLTTTMGGSYPLDLHNIDPSSSLFLRESIV